MKTQTTAKFNKSEIFKAAWNLVKTAGKTISEALKSAWAAVKAPKDIKIVNLALGLERVQDNIEAGWELDIDRSQAQLIEMAKEEMALVVRAFVERFGYTIVSKSELEIVLEK